MERTGPVVGVGTVRRVIGAGEMGIQIDRWSKSEAVRLQEFLLPLIVPEEAICSGRNSGAVVQVASRIALPFKAVRPDAVDGSATQLGNHRGRRIAATL
jgi:hypothetical protein